MKKMTCLLIAALVISLGFYGDGNEVNYDVYTYVETIDNAGMED